MKQLYRFSAITGFLGVALGAFGAHALKGMMSADGVEIWHTATLYHLIHAVMALIAGILDVLFGSKLIRYSGWLFLLGILLFSGSLYALALIPNRAIGIITPFGGFSFIAGWMTLAVGARDLTLIDALRSSNSA